MNIFQKLFKKDGGERESLSEREAEMLHEEFAGEITPEEYLAFSEDVKTALIEWQAAEEFLNYASDPELIEYAIYDVEAARRKYTYMLGKLRDHEQNL